MSAWGSPHLRGAHHIQEEVMVAKRQAARGGCGQQCHWGLPAHLASQSLVFANGVAGTLSRGTVNSDEMGGGGMGSSGAREREIALPVEQMWW